MGLERGIMNELDLQNSIIRAMPRLILGMLHKLSIHANKGPWDRVPFKDIVAKLDEEYGELKAALEAGASYPVILNECADLANMCLIVADHVATVGDELNPPPKIEQVMYTTSEGKTLQRCAYISDAGKLCVLLLNHKDGHQFDPIERVQ
jgi:hypothetical protein